MADYSRWIVYFHPTGTGAAANPHTGRWVTSVDDAADGASYVGDSSNQADAVAQYGTGELRVSTSAVVIPGLLQPREAFYVPVANTLQENPIVAFPGRAAVELVHNRYEELWILLHRLGPHYPPEDVMSADALLFAMHGGIYRVFNSNLTPQAMLFWLSRQALGPFDGTQATVSIPLAGSGNSLDLTIPETLAERHDGNEWSVRLRRAANAGAQDVAFDAGTKQITIDTIAEDASDLAAAITRLDFVDVSAIGSQLTTWGAGNATVTGTDGALADVPAQASDDPVIYQFSGGVQTYDPDNPETIAPMVDEIDQADRITAGAMFIASPGQTGDFSFKPSFLALGKRLTLAQTFSIAMQTDAEEKPNVSLLRSGAWIEGIPF